MPVIVGLLILWAVCVLLGFVFKAIAWLAILGIIAFVVTLACGALYQATAHRRQ